MDNKLDIYAQREDIQGQLLRQKEEEIFKLSQDLKES
jgi:hypothetical protein